MKESRWLAVVAVLNVCVAGVLVVSIPLFLITRLLLAAAALVIAIGLWSKNDWARRSTIVLWTAYMAIAVPVAVLGGFRRFGVAGGIVALIVAIGLPVLIVLYLSQPEIKQSVGA